MRETETIEQQKQRKKSIILISSLLCFTFFDGFNLETKQKISNLDESEINCFSDLFASPSFFEMKYHFGSQLFSLLIIDKLIKHAKKVKNLKIQYLYFPSIHENEFVIINNFFIDDIFFFVRDLRIQFSFCSSQNKIIDGFFHFSYILESLSAAQNSKSKNSLI